MRKIKTRAVKVKYGGNREFVVSSGFNSEGELVYNVSTCDEQEYGRVCLQEELTPKTYANILDAMIACWEGTDE
jgi:hypothetical protein